MPSDRRLAPALCLGAILSLTSCGTRGSDAALYAPAQTLPGATSSPAAATIAVHGLQAPTLPENTPMPETHLPGAAARLSPAETAALAQADLAASLQVTADRLAIVATHSRIWPDRGLGCVARKGVFEPERIPGYEIIVAHAGVQYMYHSDEFGRIVRCPNPAKPLGPIR